MSSLSINRYISSLATASLILSTYVSASEEWGANLPWDELTSKLSTDASLITTTFQEYTEQCIPELVNYPWPERTTHALIDQPAGLCLPHFYCGWSQCYPRPSNDEHASTIFEQFEQDSLSVGLTDAYGPEAAAFLGVEPMSTDFDLTNPDGFILDESNPSLNLPTRVLFPVIASDVIAAINFAKEHGLEISVKNSGHSYTGSSSKKDTLLLNMNMFTQYSPTGITDCDESVVLDSEIAQDLINQACHLSIAKDKPAVLRVGGGENFDKVYRAVTNANKTQEGGYKYHLVGGAAGTVSPMGWTWLGGLGGTTGSRLYGLGVDQVVQIEMVLPNGHHVKFGPTEWEDAEGFIVPKTTLVTGVCRSNPEEVDEEKWVWETCPDDFNIDFNDLWFAVRGGGGGTWGVVTSVLLQLHDYLPYHKYQWNKDSPTDECTALDPLWNEFKAMYLIMPSLLNVTKEMSYACSSPDVSFLLNCYGEDDVVPAFSRLLSDRNIPDAATDCLSKTAWNDFAEGGVNGDADRYPGQVGDSPNPSPAVGSLGGSILVPQSWIEENFDLFVEKYINGLGTPSPYYSFGGASSTASDQANALSQAHREAALMTAAFVIDDNALADFWANISSDMFDTSNESKFPPIVSSNHASSLISRPLKEDWTKPCPAKLTFEERDANCISFSEVIYGTDRLKRLEEIKLAVDPTFMFDCEYCILNNRPKSDAIQEEEEEVDNEVEVEEQGGDVVLADSGSVSLGRTTLLFVVLSVGLLSSVLLL